MIHERQRLAFGFEAGDDLFGVHAQLDDLEGHRSMDGLHLLCPIDHPVATFADLLEQLVMVDPVTGLLGDHAGDRPVPGLFRQKARGRFVGLQQGLDPRQQRRVLPAGALEVAEPAFGGRNVQRGLEEVPLAIAVVSRCHSRKCPF
jgi:hypothetical protein